MREGGLRRHRRIHEHFERLAEEGRRALEARRPEHAAALLHEALALWRGPSLAEPPCEAYVCAEIARLEEQPLAALEVRVEADPACDRHAELVAELWVRPPP
jgi:DNA-binding SARP family transcriptional activator